MHSWPVVCVEVDPESSFDDCRRIEAVGFLVANSIRVSDVEQARGMLESDLAAFHLDRDGDRVPLAAAADDGVRYLRTLEEDSPDDPLLDLATCDEVEFAERFDR